MLHLTPQNYPELEQTRFYFQLTFYRRLMPDPHDHSFYELVYLIEGSLTHVVNGVPCRMEEGTLLLLRPGDSHELRDQLPHTNVLSLSICCEEMERFLHCYNCDFFAQPEPPSIVLPPQSRAELKRAYDQILLVDYDHRVDYQRILLGVSMHLFLAVAHPPAERDGSRSHFLEALLQFNTPENIREGVPALLRLTSFSHAQLCRVMKRTMNVTPQQYVVDLRLNMALQLLKDTDLTLQSIAEQIGYASPSHFITIFTKRYHATPSAFARTRRESD